MKNTADAVKPSDEELAAARVAIACSRRCINALTIGITRMLCERDRHSLVIGDAKRVLGLPVLDKNRELEVLRMVAGIAITHGNPVDKLVSQFRMILCMSRVRQKQNHRRVQHKIGVMRCCVCGTGSPGVSISGQELPCCPNCKLPTLVQY